MEETNPTNMTAAAEERKRKRLEAWRKKKEAAAAPAPKISLSVNVEKIKKKKVAPKPPPPVLNPFSLDADDEEEEEEEKTQEEVDSPLSKKLRLQVDDIMKEPEDESASTTTKLSKRGKRWDQQEAADALDQFMENLQTAVGVVDTVKIDVSGSVMQQQYQPADWLSDAQTDDEGEQEGRRALIEALKQQPAMVVEQEKPVVVVELKEQVVSEKTRREHRLKELEVAAARAAQAKQTNVDIGRMDQDGAEDGVVEEAERMFELASAPDALTILAELNKKKELQHVDHSKVEYPKFTKNIYRVPRALAKLTHDQVVNRRAQLKVRVRGQGAPAPVEEFSEMGLPESILETLQKSGITKPYPIQAQCIPCVLAGRDVIGIAKTGSG